MREAATVAVVQPNIPEHIKLDPARALDSTFASLDRLLPRVEPGSVDLVVMPEVTFTLYPRSRAAEGGMARVQRYARELGAPIGTRGGRRGQHGEQRGQRQAASNHRSISGKARCSKGA